MSESRKRRQNSGLRSRTGSGEITQRSSQQNRGKMNHSSHSKIHPTNANSNCVQDRDDCIIAHDRFPVWTEHQKINFQRQGSYDTVRKIVQEEGRSARNLIQWNVPVDQEEQIGSIRKTSHPSPRSPGRRTSATPSRSGSTGSRSKGVSDRENTPPPGKKHEDSGVKLSASGSSKKGDLRARYWAFLFENLRRAVDEIYQTCEADESVVECKEVIMMLEQCTKDFKSLIERLLLLEAYDNAEEGQKPTSLAWEVRKSSPGKGLQPAAPAKDHLTPTPTVVRSLNFSIPDTKAGNSWADKVKGSPPVTALPPQIGVEPLFSKHEEHAAAPISPVPGIMTLHTTDDDLEGWETVQRGGRLKNRASGGGTSSNNGSSNTQSTRSSHLPFKDPSPPLADSDSQRASATREISPKPSLMRSQSGPPEFTHSQPADPKEGLRGVTEGRESEKENRPLSAQQQNNLRNQVAGDKGAKNPWAPIPAAKSLDNIDICNQEMPLARSESPPGRANLQPLRTSRGMARGLGRLTLTDTSGMDDDDFSSDDERERDDAEEKLTKQLEKELKTVEKIEAELEKEQEAALEEATEEEQSYLKEIEREKNTEIIVDTEPETDGELGGTNSSADFCLQSLDQSLDQSLELDTSFKPIKETSDLKKHLSWADMMDEAETRTPGRVVHMHEKLSSPSRKRSLTETRKRSEEKQLKARDLREKLNAEKAERLHLLTGKVEEVRSWKDELLHQRKLTIERKMDRAEEKRQVQLRQKVRKAHEEETKANEIAFINTLEAQNKRHDIITKHQEVETRLQDLQEERQRKHEEKAAKEAAVEERRKALEAERLQRLQEMQDRRRQRASEFEQRQQTRERERLEAARAKERTREERIAVLNAQQQAHIEELQKKIQQKQDESARRHKENLENIREKAFEMSVLKHSTEDHNDAPRLVPYLRKKLCNVCNILIPSEVYLMSHLRGRKHQMALKESGNGQDLSKSEIEAFNLAHIADAPSDKPDPRVVSDKERQKALKKRCKKLRQRMTQRGSEYESALAGKQQTPESEHRAKLQKVVKDLNKYLSAQDSGPWAQNRVSALDRALGEIARIMEKRAVADQTTFRLYGGMTTLSRILLVVDKAPTKLPPVIPIKSLCHTCNVFRLASKGCYDNCHYMLFSNKIGSLVDLLVHQLSMLIPDNFGQVSTGGAPTGALPYDPLSTSLMQLIATILNCLAKNNPMMSASDASAERMSSSGDSFSSRANDIISYIVSVGVVDRLAQYFTGVRGSIDDNQQAAEFLQHSLALLTSMIKLVSRRNSDTFEEDQKVDDASQLLATFRVTDIVGIMSLLYGMLLHTGAPSRGDQPPPKLPPHTVTVTTMAIKMLNTLATVDLSMFQATLGAEGTSLELRHIVAYLAWYCSNWTQEELLHEVIMCVGYFTVLNQDNQLFMQSGQPPTVLQQLCLLPFQYFSDPALTNVLFPTLIACCYRSNANREILEQELSCDLLANFIESEQHSLQSEKQLEAQAKLTASVSKKTKALDKEAERLSLNARFPTTEWDNAKDYFKKKEDMA